MFIDKAKLYIKAGKGGDGCLSFHREKYRPLGGPDGGNGGKGGDVIIKGEKNLKTLLDLQRHPHYKSKDGEHGWSSNCYGKSSKDLFINVPLGTVVKKNDIIIADITENNQETVVALGGRGGRGNAAFKTSRNNAPRVVEKGQPGEECTIELELKMIADVGILGYPNAGKSTFLSKVTSARPKIADYPFTTLTPNLGVVSFYDRTLIFADIPGLIEGASKGKGLGHDFLRHIERTKILLHMVDAYGYNKKNAYSTYLAINKELKDYSKKLAKKLQIIAVNKIDVPGSEKSLKLFKKKRKTVFPISALKGEGLKPLLAEILKKIDTVKEEEPIEIKTINYKYEPEFSIIRINNYFEVIGKKILDLIAMTNFNEEESIRRFQNILKKIGVDQKLKEEGIKIGDIVKIGDFEFHYEE
ncbi:MAG: GTPase ObgE [Elusimicrobia bacterium RIFOXYC2_FULL_34_12]|nr:MAG: GTPase ObgE [Elusimicrobia bacterium RIFOXYC2_FULL_34_12]OGS38913.1 MAG: GTPase ObgE [Elusimicrobia bacterium RIFOXYD2_FULL_34_30]HAM39028.1 GTPase ObgE [Elusimicrobiota bacterium]